jgi:hypothetical protein
MGTTIVYGAANLHNDSSFESSIINFETVSDTNIFTIPTGFKFCINQMEVITISGTPGSPATVRFGNSGDRAAYVVAIQTTSNAVNERHIFDSPQDAVNSATIISAGVTIASNAAHTGYFIFRGYLLSTS